ncbi:MAG: translation initiation factor Sui1 [Deltaproteobacteria bacterium]|nr:translation initiation factor Sui1 [Deltaproteobacteria bacterium]MBW2417057.1 translation initiation factor Sui1 [Deltaproteobacteria bacterium]
MSGRRTGDELVYSSEHGRMCPHCGLSSKRCLCRKNPRGTAPAPSGDGIARVRREKKGRKGKTVTTISGLPLDEEDLRELAKELKRKCGSGGSIKDGVIEIQGDHCDDLMQELRDRDIRAKRAGG